MWLGNDSGLFGEMKWILVQLQVVIQSNQIDDMYKS